MARAEFKSKPNGTPYTVQDIGQAIVAAWYKALPEVNPGKDPRLIANIDVAEVTAALDRMLKTPFQAVIDPKDGSKIHVVIPQPPQEVYTRQQLIDYLKKFHDTKQPEPDEHFHGEMGTALIFGCGR